MTGPEDPRVQLWRRALLLTGRRDGAERVVARVIGDRESVRKLSAHRRDRLLIQASREWVERSRKPVGAEPEPREPIPLDGAGRQLWLAIHGLPRQPAEAWMLLDVENLPEIDAARAMDCSRTAMKRHREAAAAAIAPLLGDGLAGAIEGIRAGLVAADPGASFAEVERLCAAARRRRRLVSLGQLAVLVACMGLIIWVAFDLFKANDRERDRRDMIDHYSLPIGDEAPAPPPAGEPAR